MEFGKLLEGVRREVPLVQCITNFVTVNDCANIILAVGGSPTMAHDIREVEEAVAGAKALVLNLGAIGDGEAMLLAGKRANELGIPVILDPVAVGVTSLRRETADRLLKNIRFAVIRGNASEIHALAWGQGSGSGVDVTAEEALRGENLKKGIQTARRLAESTGGVVVISGETDIVVDRERTAIFRNGGPVMARITGSGCMLSCLIGAFCGAFPDLPFESACGGVGAMGVCGDEAEKRRLEKATGNATFRTDLIDGVFNLTEEQLEKGVCYEIF